MANNAQLTHESFTSYAHEFIQFFAADFLFGI